MKNKWKSTIAVALSAVLSVAATGITASAETSNTELSVVTFDYATKTENTAILDVDALHQKNQKKISDLKLSEETINEAYNPVSASSEISPLLGGDSPDSIIGTDDQVQVNPNQFPYCAVLALRLGRDTNGDGVSDTWYLGTGYLEGHDTMATAGHNFWTGSGWINECCVYVRQNSSTYGNTYYYPASWICSTAYTSNSSDSYNYDWCVVTLQNNLGGSNGWFGKVGENMKNMKRFIILLSSLLIVSSLSSVVAFAEENESTGAYIPEGIEIADPIVSDENKIQKDNKENDLNVISDVSDLITDHETIITMLNDFVKGNQLSDVRIGDDKTSGKVILSYYYVYPGQGDMFKNFISEKNIDANEIMILVMEGAIEAPDKEEENSLITDHETIIAMLNDFVKENQMSDVRIGDDEASGKIILSYYYVYPEQKEMFENFISEKNIDVDEITILVMESAAEVSDNL